MKNSYHMSCQGCRHPQLGFTLIELMVSITVGLLVLLAFSTIFIATSQSFKTEGTLRDFQDAQRMSFSSLSGSIQIAGYYPAIAAVTGETYYTTAQAAFPAGAQTFSPSTFASGQTVTGTTGTTSDSIAVRFVQDPASAFTQQATIDCTGATVATGTTPQLVVNMFTISNNQLTCTSSVGGTPQVLVSGVQSMKILYGVDPGLTGSVTQYLTASGVTAAAAWGSVRSVQITLNFVNQLASTANPNQTIAATRVISVLSTL